MLDGLVGTMLCAEALTKLVPSPEGELVLLRDVYILCAWPLSAVQHELKRPRRAVSSFIRPHSYVLIDQ